MHPSIPVRKITPSKDTLKHKQRTEMTRTSSISLQVKTKRLKHIQHNQQHSGNKLLGNKYLTASGGGVVGGPPYNNTWPFRNHRKPKGVALQMLGLNMGHKVKIQTAGKDFWGARVIENWKWEVFESPPENLTSHMDSWQMASGCSDSLWAAAHLASLML